MSKCENEENILIRIFPFDNSRKKFQKNFQSDEIIDDQINKRYRITKRKSMI
jgi:hypothetical protein